MEPERPVLASASICNAPAVEVTAGNTVLGLHDNTEDSYEKLALKNLRLKNIGHMTIRYLHINFV